MARLSREESRARTQEKLRAAALREFAFSGIAATSIDRISEAAGFSRGAFYANYKSKQDILLVLLKELNERELADWHNTVDSHADLHATLTALDERFTLFVNDNEWGLFAVEAQLHAKRDPEFAIEYQRYLEDVIVRVSDLLGAIFAKAGKRPPYDLKAIAFAFHSLATGLSIASNAAHPAADSADLAIRVPFLRGLIALAKPL